jgi:hypothetical protein
MYTESLQVYAKIDLISPISHIIMIQFSII